MAGDTRPTFDFDPHDGDLFTCPHDVYAKLREVGPIVWSPLYGGHWAVTDMELCKQIAGDRVFSSASGLRVPPGDLTERGVHIFALETDLPDHAWQRRLLSDAVGDRPSKVDTELIQRHADALLNRLDLSGPVDLIAGYANPLPLDVVFAAIGADEEFKPEMKALADRNFGRPVDIEDPAGRLIEIATTLIERRKESPTDDWISDLFNVEIDGEPLSVFDVVNSVISLISGGHHSTSRAIGSLLARMLTEPGLQKRMRSDADAIAAAAEETVRLHTPLPKFGRTATKTVDIGGVTITKGEVVLMLYEAANQDPSFYDAAAEFRLDRNANDHVAYGYGPHRCVGIHLARAELRIATTALFARSDWLTVQEPITWLGPAEPESLVVTASDAAA